MREEQPPGFASIDWHLFLNTPKQSTAGTILNRIAKLLGEELNVVSMEPYWKIETLFDVRFTTALDTPDAAAAVWALLTSVQRVTNGFSTSGPLVEADGRMEMSVLSDSGFRDSGLNWLMASVRNSPPDSAAATTTAIDA